MSDRQRSNNINANIKNAETNNAARDVIRLVQSACMQPAPYVHATLVFVPFVTDTKGALSPSSTLLWFNVRFSTDTTFVWRDFVRLRVSK